MMCAATAAMIGGGKLSARSYVQDGLVAMWDGIENAGWGQHDPNATVWKNLAKDEYNWTGVLGGYDIGEWTDNSYWFNKQPTMSQYTTQTWNIPRDSISTLEAVYKRLGGSAAVLMFNESRDRFFACKSTSCAFGINPSNGIEVDADIISNGFCISALYSNTSVVDVYVNGAKSSNPIIEGYSYGRYRYYATFGRDNYNNALGYLYCTRLYSRALTADEIAANYAVDKARFNLPDET